MQFYHGEQGYLDLLKFVRETGVHHPDRTDVGSCYKVLSPILCFDHSNGFPSHTLRTLSLRLGFEEFWAFMNGVVNIHPYLSPKGIDFWKGNTTREFLDQQGLGHLPEGSLGKSYSFQYRNFGGDFTELSKREGTFVPDYSTGIDQLKNVIEGLKKDPFGRRHLVSIWNPLQLKDMVLPPCFWAHNFMTMKRPDGEIELHLKVFSRSADLAYGVPNNYQQFAVYHAAVAEYCGYHAGSLLIDMMDCHIYENQLDFVDEIIETRKPSSERVRLIFKKKLNSFEDILSLTWEDIVLENLHVDKRPIKTKRPKMAV